MAVYLGGLPYLGYNLDYDNITGSGLVYLGYGHSPSREGWLIQIQSNGGDSAKKTSRMQFYYEYDGSRFATRFYNWDSGAWTAWQDIPCGLASFYQSYNSLQALVTGSWSSGIQSINASTNIDNLAAGVYNGIGWLIDCVSQAGYLICGDHTGSYKFQIAISYSSNENKMLQRTYNGGWSAWKEVATDIPSFYKDYSTLAALASALGVINLEHFPYNANMDSYEGLRFLEQFDSGIVESMTNLPSNIDGGEIQAIVLSNAGYGVQILFHSSSGKVYLRFERGSGNFTSWNEWY